jgi:hypothetical protein
MATKILNPLRAMRAECMECSGDNSKVVIWCTCDGLHSTRCELWPYRFGRRPATIRQKYGPRLMTPGMMPGDGVDLDDLPNGLEAASVMD